MRAAALVNSGGSSASNARRARSQSVDVDQQSQLTDALEQEWKHLGLQQKEVAYAYGVDTGLFSRQMADNGPQLNRLLKHPELFRRFARRMAQIAGFEVVEPDARVQAIAEAMGALQRVLEVVAVDLRLPERSAAQLKAKL